jgi:hypothetical protein
VVFDSTSFFPYNFSLVGDSKGPRLFIRNPKFLVKHFLLETCYTYMHTDAFFISLTEGGKEHGYCLL